MTIYACIDCALLYDIVPGERPICPRCDKLLGLRREEPDKAATMAEIASEVLHGPPRPRRRSWSVE